MRALPARVSRWIVAYDQSKDLDQPEPLGLPEAFILEWEVRNP
jgi:hypothetical protein